MPNLSVIILTKNEELHISRAIESVRAISSQIYVIDSNSTDGTRDIARALGAKVMTNPFVNQAKQFQWALENTGITDGWILRLDADEIIEPDLALEILQKLERLSADITGVNLARKHIFMGKWIRYGGRYPLLMLRIFRAGKGEIEDRWMDEHITITDGRTVTFEGGFSDHNLNGLSYFIDKHNKYATREAIEVLNQRHNLLPHRAPLSANNASAQASTKRQLKERVFNKIPFVFSSTLYFIWRYIFQLGFMDGRAGACYHFLQGYWYRFLVGAKVMELEIEVSNLSDPSEIRKKLSELTGLQLEATERTLR